MRISGTVSPSKAARLLDRHYNTVYEWCRRAVRGEPSPLQSVTRDERSGYYRVNLAEVRELQRTGGGLR